MQLALSRNGLNETLSIGLHAIHYDVQNIHLHQTKKRKRNKITMEEQGQENQQKQN